jgi:L-ascorbate metabolism protein UlaG (beta-lactamase superfamily)
VLRVRREAHLEFVGHACFRIWRDGGPVVVTDPYEPGHLRLPQISLEGDIVVVSSTADAGGHANPALIAGVPRVIDALAVADGQPAEIEGEPIVALAVYEKTKTGEPPAGPPDTSVFAVRIGDVWFVHMGDLGYELDADALAAFRGRCDVLLALAGGDQVLDYSALDAIIDVLKPAWIVPMHHDIGGITHGIYNPVGEFLARRVDDSLMLARASSWTFDPDLRGLRRPTIVVLDPAGAPGAAQLEVRSPH